MKTGQASYFGQPILTALQVRETVNRLVPSQAHVDLGQVVVLLVLNRLLAPQPLYKIQDWLEETVLPEVLGIFVFAPYQGVWRPSSSSMTETRSLTACWWCGALARSG